MATHGYNRAMPSYEAVIGLEIHIQLNTQTKIFCGCKADSWGDPPNTNICPVCCGLPGVLPVLNRTAVEKAILLGAALGSHVADESFFDRKNYFYPDLPKGYQITQYDQAIVQGGRFDVPMPDGRTVSASITKAHLEEDAGKTRNDVTAGVRQIDMNRCGVPLIELVTGPDLRSAEEAAQFLVRMRQLLRWLDISEANLERGHLRCDANVSIREAGSTVLNPKTEIKNVNSIDAVRNAIEAEIARQIGEVEAGRRVSAWTLDWDDETQTLKKMRSKETEADYRYFRDPDLLSAMLTPEWKSSVLAALPELPLARRSRFVSDYGLSAYDAAILTDERSLSDYYETTVKLLGGNAKAAANWMMNDVLRVLNESGGSAADLAFKPEHLAETIKAVEAGTINRATGTALIPKVIATGRAPGEIIAAEGLAQISGDDALKALAQSVLDENPQQIEAYRKKPSLLKWFVGQAMRKSQGKANAQALETIFISLLPSTNI